MFEKIIEKIEEEIGFKAHECLKGFISDDNFTGYCHSANYVIDILKEEENKPFNPESFGFISNELENIWEIKINKAIYSLSWHGGDKDKSYWEIRIKNTPSERLFFGIIFYG